MAATLINSNSLHRGDVPRIKGRNNVYSTSQQVAALRLHQHTTKGTHDKH